MGCNQYWVMSFVGLQIEWNSCLQRYYHTDNTQKHKLIINHTRILQNSDKKRKVTALELRSGDSRLLSLLFSHSSKVWMVVIFMINTILKEMPRVDAVHVMDGAESAVLCIMCIWIAAPGHQETNQETSYSASVEVCQSIQRNAESPYTSMKVEAQPSWLHVCAELRTGHQRCYHPVI